MTPEKAHLLTNIKLIPPERLTEQRESFTALLDRLGVAASDEEVAHYLMGREPVEPEPDLKLEAVERLRVLIKQAG